MGWIVGALLASAFLYFGGPQVTALILERGPTSLSCREFLEGGADVRWLSLHDCAVDWPRQREFQATRYRKAIYVPIRPPGRSPRQLLIRIEPEETGRDRAVWRGMLDTPATEDVPPFATGAPMHILYTNRPSPWEMALAVVPGMLFVVALTRSVRQARVRAADTRRLRRRFPPRADTGVASRVDITPVVDASRAARGAAVLAGLTAGLAIVICTVSIATTRSTRWTIAAVIVIGAVAAIAYWRRAALDDRLLAIGGAAIAGSLAITIPLCLAMRQVGPAVVAVPLLCAAVWALRARRTLRAGANDLLVPLLRAVQRAPRRRVSHSSASRRPFRVTAYRVSAAVAVAIGLMGIVVTGTGITLWIGLAVGVLLWNRGTRHATFDARTVLERDPRAPVLLLRSFADDDLEAKGTTPMPWSSTQTLAFVAATRLQAIGPVIAVAPPGEKLPPLGPYRVFVQMDDWRAEVDRLIDTAKTVVVFLGHSEGLLWELGRLLDGPRSSDLILVVPPAEPASLEKRWDALSEVTRRHPAWRAVRDLEPLSTLLVRSMPDGRLQAFHGRQRNAGYDWAFRLCAASL